MVSGGLFRFNPCPKVDIHVDLDANVVINVDVRVCSTLLLNTQ